MPRLSKYDRGLCGWPRCQESRDARAPWSYKDETWVLPLYCKTHGPRVVARRKARIAKEAK